MPPKEKAVSESGSVALNGNGALARLQVAGRKVNGPQRGTRAEAQADLDQARQCASREEMATLLEQLRAGAVNVAVSHNDSGFQPAEPHRKRHRTKGTPSTVESQSAALNPVASSSGLCQNKEDATSRKAAVVPGMSQRDQELVRKSQGDALVLHVEGTGSQNSRQGRAGAGDVQRVCSKERRFGSRACTFASAEISPMIMRPLSRSLLLLLS